MNVVSKLLQISLFILLGCSDSSVATLFVSDGNHENLRKEAVARLYKFYSNSSKEKEFYEVVSRPDHGHYIVNYNPRLQLLSICADPGSGWAAQFKNVTEEKLQRLSESHFSMDNMYYAQSMRPEYSELLTQNDTFLIPKSNWRASMSE